MSGSRPPPAADPFQIGRHLHEERKGSLSRSEVGEVQTDISRKYPHEGDVRIVVPLRDHLRADQDVQIPVFQPL